MNIFQKIKSLRNRLIKADTSDVILAILIVSQLFAIFGRYIPKAEYFQMLIMLGTVLACSNKISYNSLVTALIMAASMVAGILGSFLLDKHNNNIPLCFAFAIQSYMYISLAQRKEVLTEEKLSALFDKILKFGCCSCIVNLLLNLGAMLSMNPEGYAYGVNFSSFYAGRNEFAYYLLLYTAICSYQLLRKRRGIYLAQMLLILLNLFLTFSRASILAAGVYICMLALTFVWNDKRLQRILIKLMIPVAVVGIAVVIINFDFLDQYLFRTGYGDSYRFLWWRTGIAAFFESPVLGYGPGAAEFILKGLGDNTGSSFHNTFVEIIVWGGLLLSILYLILAKQMVDAVKTTKKRNIVFYRVFVSLFVASIVYGCFETNMLFALGAKGTATTIVLFSIPIVYSRFVKVEERRLNKRVKLYPLKDLISVIIPAYNAEKTIEACMDSILQQTYRNFEIIVVDDGSTDRTLEILERYAKSDRRVRCFHKPNGGQSSARNYGLEKMRGSLFTYVDSDDAVKPEMLMQLYMALNDASADMSMCAMVRKVGSSETVMYAYDAHVVEGTEQIYREFLSEKYVFGPVCKLMRTDKYGDIRFTEGIIFEDIEMLSRAYLRAECVALCPYPGYLFVVREGSTTKSEFNVKKLDLLKVTKVIEKRVLNSGMKCRKELRAFVLNGYLTILLMAMDSGVMQKYSRLCNTLIEWIREEWGYLLTSTAVPITKKLYVMFFVAKNPRALKILMWIRRCFR